MLDLKKKKKNYVDEIQECVEAKKTIKQKETIWTGR